jgi:hypothetical protein
VPRRVPELPAGPRVAGPSGAAAKAGRRSRGDRHLDVSRTDQVAPLPAGRPALADRDALPNREGGAAPCRCPGGGRDAGPPPAGRVPRGPQRAVRHLPRLRPDQEGAGLDRGRRAGGDVPAVGADGGAHRARVGRAAGPAPGQAQLQRAALGEETGRRGRAGEGDPVRGAAGDGPQGPVRADRPGGGP